MNIDNQKEYWDEVAGAKTFTHPLDQELLQTFVGEQSVIVDFGCGYGRLVKQLLDEGFTNLRGYDTSKDLVARGRSENNLPLYYLGDPRDLPLEDNSVDCILLFAVLTCIPSNKGQQELISLLTSKLKSGGILYLSDYYLQEKSIEIGRYEYLNNDKNNYGVFSLPEGATFRHHTKEWIGSLIAHFNIVTEKHVVVKTMNGNTADGFQILARK